MKVSSPVGEYPYHVQRVSLRGGRVRVDGWFGPSVAGPAAVLTAIAIAARRAHG